MNEWLSPETSGPLKPQTNQFRILRISPSWRESIPTHDTDIESGAGVLTCDDQDGIDVAVEAELLDADHSVAEVLARVEPVVVRVVVDAEDLLPRRHVRRGHRVREHFLHLLLLLEVEGGELRLVLFVAIHGS